MADKKAKSQSFVCKFSKKIVLTINLKMLRLARRTTFVVDCARFGFSKPNVKMAEMPQKT
jgi:hypothetical protein